MTQVRKNLEIAYRGQRNYLHGTDYYRVVSEALVDCSGEAVSRPINLAIHHLSTHGVDLVMEPGACPPGEKPPRYAVEFSSGAGWHGWLVETDREVVGRVPFDEAAIISAVNVEADTASMIKPVEIPAIDVLVIMVKHWHQVRMPSETGNWMFVQLELSRLLRQEDNRTLQVRLKQRLAGRYTQMEVCAVGEVLGVIHFACVPKKK